MSKKYIGIDLGAWQSSKTKIAVCEICKIGDNNRLNLLKIEKEPTSKKESFAIRDDRLIEKLKELSCNNAVIAIDAPFSIPSYLKPKNFHEQFYESINSTKGEITNQYMFDNSARFVFEKTNQIVLAPTGDKIGRLTSRMAHIFSNSDWLKFLNPITNPNYNPKDNQIQTIEVYPRATLKKLLENQDKPQQDIPQYKNKKWNDNKEKMLKLIEEFIKISDKQKDDIKSDDDYDAIICALTAYFVDIDTKGFLKPDSKDINKFTNSFIYMPKI
jgi:predicted RNase H-like nuclease